MSVEQIIQAAREAKMKAYSPYSNYSVGAAVQSLGDEVWTGCNIENASYGLSICAERVAIFKMVSSGIKELRSVAVCTKDGGHPCGACLQVINEFGSASTRIYLENERREIVSFRLEELLPHPFRL